jgi:sugar transferase (PEP-CTERM/EpsH1 system associated)
MKILFLCHRFPYPPDDGAKIRAYYFIRHLSRNHTVTVATLAHTKEEVSRGAGLNDYCEQVIAEVLPSHERWFHAIAAFVSRFPSSVAYFWSRKLNKRLDETFAEEKFDGVIVFCAFMAQYIVGRKTERRVLDFCDIDSRKWSEYSEHKVFPFSLAYAFEAAKLRKYERAMSEEFDCCTVISEGERTEATKIGITVPCSVVANGVDTKFFVRNKQVYSQALPIIVFFGRMDYFPNVDAITYFARDVLPLISKARPTVQLRIIGSNPTQSVKRLADIPNVRVTGFVADIREWVRDAAVSVAPLRIARGIQNKVLESMAMGIPVVASSEAANGFAPTLVEHLLLADGPADFAAKVLQVLSNEDLRTKLSEGGRKQVQNAHSWPVSLRSLDTVLTGAQEAIKNKLNS